MNLDWSACDANGWPEDTVECRCGATFRSHVKGQSSPTGWDVHTRKPCPACGRSSGHVRAAYSEPE